MSLIDSRGRWHRWNSKSTTGAYLQLDMSVFSKQVGLETIRLGSWNWRRSDAFGERKSSISYSVIPGQGVRLIYSSNSKEYSYLVRVETTKPNYGGLRYWWVCPNLHCGRRVRILYGGEYFVCRKCQNLTYATSQAGKNDLDTRIHNQLFAIRRKLKASGGILDPLPDKPKWLHYRTYWRLCLRYQKLLELHNSAWAVQLHSTVRLPELAERGTYTMLPHISGYVRSEWKKVKGTKSGEELLQDLAHNLTTLERVEEPPVKAQNRFTLGELATIAGVPFEFAQEAVAAGLVRADQGRTTRRKRYRDRLKNWLRKLHQLRQAGLTWEEITAWSKRRWLPGYEEERHAPKQIAEKASHEFQEGRTIRL